MNRRGFLATLGTLAAAFALDPDLALWVPGRKTFFLPASSSLTLTLPASNRNQFVTPDFERAVDRESGISLRFVRQYDIQTDQKPSRRDVYAIQSTWLGRIQG